MKKSVAVRSLKKSFKGMIVLDGLSLEMKKGALIHIRGGNGSGKSTLLKLIAKLTEPDSGSVYVEKTQKIGGLIENPMFIEHETALFNLQFLAELTGTFDWEKTRDLMQQFDLEISNKKPVKSYSLGMRQKLGIIQAIMENQDLILLDEPTRGLDRKSVAVFNEIIESLRDAKKTCIICAHDGVSNIHFDAVYELEYGEIREI